MNPGAAAFGPGAMSGVMYMPGGGGYFAAPGFPQTAWQGAAQYGGQYGMNPAAANMQAAMQAGAGGQQGMPGVGAGGMGGGQGPQQPGAGSGPYAAAAAGGPKPGPSVTPTRVRLQGLPLVLASACCCCCGGSPCFPPVLPCTHMCTPVQHYALAALDDSSWLGCL